MKNVKLFMAAYYRERIENEREYQKLSVSFRNRYFTETCKFDSHSEKLKMLESEEILKIEEGLDSATVVTEYQFESRGIINKVQRRYSLERKGEGWRINDAVLSKMNGRDVEETIKKKWLG